MTFRILSLTLFLFCTFVGSVQAQTKSPSQTYLAYHKAVVAASMEEFLSHMSAEAVVKMRAQLAKHQAENLEMMATFTGIEKNLKVVSEKINGTKATLKTTFCSLGKSGTSDVSMVLEGAAWKVGNVHSKVALKKCT